jgi:WD40 repeat protein
MENSMTFLEQLRIQLPDSPQEPHLASWLAEAAAAYAPNDPALQILEDYLVKSGHLLRRCDRLNDILATLLSRLQHRPELTPLTQALTPRLTRPYLTCRQPPPDLPHPFLIRTLEEQQWPVSNCAISADGTVIVSASHWDKSLKVWDAASGVERLTLVGHTSHVNDCDISADGTTIASAARDGTLKVWDARTGTERLTLTGHTAQVRRCSISGDGSSLVSVGDDGLGKVWDARTGAERFTLAGHITDGTISTDGTIIVSTAVDQTLKVWDAHTGSERLTLNDPNFSAGCEISADVALIVSYASDQSLKVWDASSGVERFSLPHHSPISACAISANGAVIVSATQEEEFWAVMDAVRIQANSLKIWDAQSGVELATLIGHTSWVNDCAISADGAIIVSAAGDIISSAFDHTLKIWDTRRQGEFLPPSEQTVSFRRCASSADGSVVVSRHLLEDDLTIWDGYMGKQRYTIKEASHFALSADGAVLVTSSRDNTLKLWEVSTGTERLTLTGPQNRIDECTISADGTVVVAIAYDDDYWTGNHFLQVWDTRKGVLRLALPAPPGPLWRCTLSADGAVIVATPRKEGLLKVWDAQTGAERLTIALERGEIWDLAINADGTFITAATYDYEHGPDYFLKVWDAQTGAERLNLNRLEFRVEGCVISADGSLIVSASGDGNLRVWDAHSGERLAMLAFNWPLYDCACSTDGQYIVVVGRWGIYFLQLVR